MKSVSAREANRRYSEKHKEKLRERNLKYRLAHPEITVLQGAKGRAKKKGLEFNLEPSDISIPTICPILGIKLERAIGTGLKLDSSPSLDRIDPNKGYIKGNVWVISQKANAMKSNATQEELFNFAAWVLNNDKNCSNS